jgi:hypothetical protein
MQGRYQDAEGYFLQALKRAQEFGTDDLRLAQSLNSLGGLTQRMGKHRIAQQYLEQAIVIYYRVSGPTVLKLGTCKTAWVLVLTEQGRLRR